MIIRFKKSNGNGVGSNINTQAELDFCDLQVDLPGYPGLQKIEIVYSLNVTETAIADITVLARSGDRRLWSYDIAGSGGATVMPFMQPKRPLPDFDIDRMIVPKKPDEQAEEGDK